MRKTKADYIYFFVCLIIYLYFFFSGARTGRFTEGFLVFSWLTFLFLVFIIASESGFDLKKEIRDTIAEMRKNFINSENIRECGKKSIEHNGRGEKKMQKCPYCGAWFRTKKALNIHITKRHKKKKKRR